MYSNMHAAGHTQKQQWGPLVLFPLACIWYSDAIGSSKYMRVCNTRASVSGYTIASVGWFILLVPVCLAIAKHFHLLDS
jgi:hypothetical protein